MLPTAGLQGLWRIEEVDGFRVLRLRAPRTKEIGYIRRTIGELLMPFTMHRNLQRSPMAQIKWDGVVWYTPSIFHGPLANSLKKRSNCKGYLIIRDIFPQWALDMRLMRRGVPYLFFDAVARYQYSVADVIGVQSPGNLSYFDQLQLKPGRRLEVLNNWLEHPGQVRCSIRLNQTCLAGRNIFVYAGNMGVAQGMDIFIDLAESLQDRSDVGFLFVGRGSDASRLSKLAQSRKLNNVLFFDEIHPDQIPDLYAQCDVGIVALDSQHNTHNIPGKFLTYMQSGLPVLANINYGNDLARIIRDEQVGQVCESNMINELLTLTGKLLEEITVDKELSERCCKLFDRDFSAEKAVRQIVNALTS
jgi:glycosyltransferase involved in cell wall biosynthesis